MTTLLKLVKADYRGYGLGRIGESKMLVGKHDFNCEFQGGIKCRVSLDSKEEMDNLEGIRVKFTWKNKKLIEVCRKKQ